MQLNIEENRKHLNYPISIYLRRLLWTIGKCFFRNSPRIAFGYRNLILRMFGAQIGRGVHIYSSAQIYFPWNLEIGDWSAIGENALIYNLGKVIIGKQVTISHKAHLCAGTHDYQDSLMPLVCPEMKVKDQAWICTEAFIGPGVTIQEGSIVGARGVLIKDTEPWGVYAGNPAKFIKKRIIIK